VSNAGTPLSAAAMAGDPSLSNQRIDRWLWHVRLLKTRTLAAEIVTQGHARVNGAKIRKASHAVRRGDVITASIHGRIRVVAVLGLVPKRVSAPEAALLYDDRSPEMPRPEPGANIPQGALREKGAGRPTKKERREIDRFRTSDPFMDNGN